MAVASTSTRRNLGVWDEQFQSVDKKVSRSDKHRMETNEGIRRLYDGEKHVRHLGTSVANFERQWGRPLTTQQFIKEVQPLNPQLKFDFVSNAVGGSLRVRRVINTPEGEKALLVCYGEKEIMPEYTIMSKVKQRAPVPTMDRRIAHMEEYEVAWRPEFRGWREMLVILVNKGLIRLPQAERLASKYGTSDRLSWAAKLGKTQGDTL